VGRLFGWEIDNVEISDAGGLYQPGYTGGQ
jgi:hypothetical protein